MLRGVLRRSLVVSVALGAAWLLLASAGDARPRAHAAAGCSYSFVDVTVLNHTQFRMDPYYFNHGFSNNVCDNLSPGSVNPDTHGNWKVGENIFYLFAAEVWLKYKLTNGDEPELYAYSIGSTLNTSCSWRLVVSSPRAFDCVLSWHGAAISEDNNGQNFITEEVRPVNVASVKGARARPAAARRCLRGSALIGTTTNQTGVPLKLVSVSHGPADGWCRAPLRSQAAHSAGHWKLGGPRSGVSARFVYRLPNGDEVDFRAAVNPRDGEIGCAPLDRARARLFGCSAGRKGGPNGESPRIDLKVFGIRPL